MKSLNENAILIGTGALTWDGKERRSDRYGTITLYSTNAYGEEIAPGSHLKVDIIKRYQGQKGRLIAEVLEVRESTHIGDIFRGFAPVTPIIGEIIELGTGHLFSENYSWASAVGLTPENCRQDDWLDPTALYKCHEQTINMYFIPTN